MSSFGSSIVAGTSSRATGATRARSVVTLAHQAMWHPTPLHLILSPLEFCVRHAS